FGAAFAGLEQLAHHALRIGLLALARGIACRRIAIRRRLIEIGVRLIGRTRVIANREATLLGTKRQTRLAERLPAHVLIENALVAAARGIADRLLGMLAIHHKKAIRD